MMWNGRYSWHSEPGAAPAPWVFQGIGDFNGGGTSDILFRNTATGGLSVWQMQNGQISVPPFAPVWSNVPSDWMFQGTGDFDRNGTSDIMWRNSVSSQGSVWLMVGGRFSRSSAFDVPYELAYNGVIAN